MLDAFQLIPALQVIFQSEIEFTAESFAPLNAAQRKAYRRKEGEPGEPIYRVLPAEPTVIDRQGNERITVELTIVTESERQLMLNAVAYIHRASDAISSDNPTFAQRLAYLRPRLPSIVVGESQE